MLSDPYGSAETPWMSVIAAKLRRLIYGDFFIYRNRMKILKKDCLGKRQPSLKPVNLAGYRRRTAIWFKKEYLATIQAFLCVNNLVILLISLALSRLDMADLPVIGTGIAGMLAGTLMGLAIHDRIPASIFGKVIYAFVGVGGLWIIISHLI